MGPQFLRITKVCNILLLVSSNSTHCAIPKNNSMLKLSIEYVPNGGVTIYPTDGYKAKCVACVNGSGEARYKNKKIFMGIF